MVSLNPDVARHRVFYPRPVAPMPDILMIDMSAGSGEAAPSFRRFHAILCETIDEQQDVEAYLDQPRDGPFPSDPLDARPATLPSAANSTVIEAPRPNRAQVALCHLRGW